MSTHPPLIETLSIGDEIIVVGQSKHRGRTVLAVCAIRLNGQTERVIRTVRNTIRTQTVAIPQ
jgi:hypothetical protein